MARRLSAGDVAGAQEGLFGSEERDYYSQLLMSLGVEEAAEEMMRKGRTVGRAILPSLSLRTPARARVCVPPRPVARV